MGIGTSDGKYFPSEMEQSIYELSQNVDVDPLLPDTKYDDSPTPQQNARDGSIYNNLKQEEQHQEENLNNYKPDAEEKTPVTPVSDLPTTKPPLPPELQGLPRITVTPKWIEEPVEQVTATDKRGFWNQITGADGQPRYKLFPERMLDHLTESASRFADLLKGDTQLPSKTGVPGSSDANDPEALRNLGSVTDMAGFLIMGPGRDAALEASPVTFQKADRALSSIENVTPASSRGGVEILGSHTHPDPRTLEEQIADIMRPRSRAEADVARATGYNNPRRFTESPTDRALQEIADALRLNPAMNPSETYSRYLRESGINSQYPRGWSEVEGGPQLSSLPPMSTKTITFANKEGQKFYIDATQYGDHIGVGMIGSMTASGLKIGINTEFANTMGIKGMRDVLRKVREEFPTAKTISGFRVTGARSSKGGGRATMDLP